MEEMEKLMKPLLVPCRIGNVTIRNRVVMTAANLGWCYGGYVTDKVVAFYRKRAAGGVGLIIAGAAGVDTARVNRVGMMQVYDDRFIPGLQSLTKAVHEEGCAIFLQLMHAGAYAKQSEHNGLEAVAPSSYFCRFTREEARELSREEICRIIEYFADGAERAKKAGFDGVELIGSAGYLISEFLSPATNTRRDEYGGSLENRIRFLQEVIRAVRDRVGKEFPIGVRLSGTDFVPKGNGPEEVVRIAAAIQDSIDVINITGGWHESSIPQITYNVPEGMYLYLARAVREAVNVPVIGCNRLTAVVAEDAVRQKDCDFAGMLRALIADPDLVRKYADGNVSAIRPCLACNQECLERIFRADSLGCAVNPYVGRETNALQNRDNGLSILVIGAGVSGLAYAVKVSKTNRVTVWEKSKDFGGSGNLVSRFPYRGDVKTYLNYLFLTCVENRVQFCWGIRTDAEMIVRALREKTFDKVVIATGSRAQMDKYPVAADARVLSAEDCIRMDKIRSSRIVVIGSSYKAVQTAQYCRLARERYLERRKFLKQYDPDAEKFAAAVMRWDEEEITLLSPAEKIGGGFGASTKWMMLEELKKGGIRVISGVKVESITREGVKYSKEGIDNLLRADLIVMAESWEKDTLYKDLKNILLPPEDAFFTTSEQNLYDRITVIGDARRLGRISEAVKDAFTVSEMDADESPII